MAEEPFISVVIPVYNGAHFLREAIDSILAQNYSPLEIIVVDDGSTDDLRAAVRGLRVDVRFLAQDNRGPGAARNLGIRNAAGEFFAFLDVDDLWPHDMLGILAARLVEYPDLDVVQGFGQFMRSDTPDGAQEFIGSARESFPYFLSAGLYRRRAFEQIGLFDADLRFSEDTDWFVRAHEKGLGIERLEQVTLRIRRHDGNMTRNKNLQELGALRLFKKALERRRGRDAQKSRTLADNRDQ
jgi:glycosyltransferase involved in cell wall biosynthesis